VGIRLSNEQIAVVSGDETFLSKEAADREAARRHAAKPHLCFASTLAYDMESELRSLTNALDRTDPSRLPR
jgi:hypothetical protein